MDTLHTVLRNISETKSATEGARPARTGGRDHLVVFREFLRHLDRAQKRNATKMGKAAGRVSKGDKSARPRRARRS
jgi:hypothetical protein